MLAVAPVSFTASATVLNTGWPEMRFATTARRDTTDKLGAVGEALLGVVGTLLARETLTDNRAYCD